MRRWESRNAIKPLQGYKDKPILSLREQIAAICRSLATAVAAKRDKKRRLAMETAAIQAIARRLAAKLRGRDPLAERVKLGRMDYVGCIMQGAMQAFARRPSM